MSELAALWLPNDRDHAVNVWLAVDVFDADQQRAEVKELIGGGLVQVVIADVVIRPWPGEWEYLGEIVTIRLPVRRFENFQVFWLHGCIECACIWCSTWATTPVMDRGICVDVRGCGLREVEFPVHKPTSAYSRRGPGSGGD